MTFDEIRQALRDELMKGPIPDAGVVRALTELAYTASETGVIPELAHVDMSAAIRLLQLVDVANRYRDGVPAKLKM